LTLLPLLAVLAAAPTDLADRIFAAGAYHSAATEYQRLLFAETVEEPAVARLKLGLSLGAAEETDRAVDALRRAGEEEPDVSFEAGMAMAGLLAHDRRPERARLELLDLLIFTTDSARREELNAALAWLDLQELSVDAAVAGYNRAGLADVAADVDKLNSLPRRSPTAAMLISSIVPGSGEIYAGRTLTGLLSLLVTGSAAAGTYLAARSDDWVTATIVFSVLFLRFYNGSRSNATDFAEEFNRRQLEKGIAGLSDAHRLEPDWFRGICRRTGLSCPAALSRSLRNPERSVPPVPAPARPE
jgi:tetratricopeptide (TPR) repeat protein